MHDLVQRSGNLFVLLHAIEKAGRTLTEREIEVAKGALDQAPVWMTGRAPRLHGLERAPASRLQLQEAE